MNYQGVKMKSSTIEWHLSRDNQLSLYKFCDKNKIKVHTGEVYQVDNKKLFTQLYQFNNNGFIKVELRAGDSRSYTIADHFQVIEYDVGS